MASDPTAQDPTLGHGPIGPETDIATICVHGGYPHEGDGTTARAAPLHRTTSYQFKSVEHAADLFALSELGNIYTRLGNPTTDILEKRLALMHGGPEMGGLAMASGTVAIFQAITNVAEAGDNIVSANNLYGGTMTMFEHILPKMGITCTFVDPKDPSSFLSVRPPPRPRPFLAPAGLAPHPKRRQGVDENTRAFFCETCANPSLDISDLETIADLAHDNGLPLIVDDTFTTAYLQRPFDHGVDVVCTSLTKWTGGHGTAIGGAIIDGGSFDWSVSSPFPRVRKAQARAKPDGGRLPQGGRQAPAVRRGGRLVPRAALGPRPAGDAQAHRIHPAAAHGAKF